MVILSPRERERERERKKERERKRERERETRDERRETRDERRETRNEAIIFLNRPGQNEKNPRTSEEAVQYVFNSHKSELKGQGHDFRIG